MIMLEPAKWQKAKQIFQSALKLQGAERPAFIKEAASGDESVKSEVEALLEAHEEAGDFLQDTAFSAKDFFRPEPGASLSGKEIGTYKILAEIGRGGMGVVYLAERADAEFTKRVAVKLIKRGLDTDEIIGRFRNERQILANLEHPNIARLLDGGTTEDGLPFLVMEYVEGLPLNEFCAERDLGLSGKLKIFREVCAAVQYAHRNLIVHRDLKPSNILVDEYGIPKLLDFGIAKLLSAQNINERGQTATNFQVMTPEYASPEQMRGEIVTTATDVYSLGIVLYELLTGGRPFSFRNESLENIVHTICHSEPLKPSSMINSKASGTDMAAAKHNPQSLRGDLDNIILMALRKEPERRYSSIEQFAEDIRRYQNGLPVIACEDSYSYRAGKFVQRNKVAAAAITGVGLSLVAGIIATTRQAGFARKQRDKATRINKFLQKMLSSADPRAVGKDAKIVEVLRIASESIEKDFAGSPEIVSDLRTTIGLTFLSIGQIESAELHLTEALEIRQRFYGSRNGETAIALSNYGKLLQAKGDLKSAEKFFRQSLQIFRSEKKRDPLDTASVLGNLGYLLLLEGKNDEAKGFLHEKLEIVSRILGKNHSEFAQTLSNLANVYSVMDDKDTAETMHRRALRLTEKLFAADHPDVAAARLHLAITIGPMNPDEAEGLLLQSLSSRRKFYGDGHIETAWALYHLGGIFLRKQRFNEAADSAIEILSWRGSSIPETHSVVISTLLALGRCFLAIDRPVDAEPLLRECVDLRRKTLPPEHWLIATAEAFLADCLLELGGLDEAGRLLQKSHSVLVKRFGQENEHTVHVKKSLEKLDSLAG